MGDKTQVLQHWPGIDTCIFGGCDHLRPHLAATGAHGTIHSRVEEQWLMDARVASESTDEVIKAPLSNLQESCYFSSAGVANNRVA